METQPKPGTISAESLCALTGYTDRHHRQLAKAGFFPPPYKGQYQSAVTVAGMFKHFRELLAKRSDTEKVLKVQTAQVKLDAAVEELANLRKLNIPKKEIGPALRNLALHQRSVLQRKLESELAPKLSGLNPLEIRALMVGAVDEIYRAFYDGVRDWMESDPNPIGVGSDSEKNAIVLPKESARKKPRSKLRTKPVSSLSHMLDDTKAGP